MLHEDFSLEVVWSGLSVCLLYYLLHYLIVQV